MILIAGGIGSGKSVVSRVLRLRGWGVFDCDYEARQLLLPSSPLAPKVCRILGENVYKKGVYCRERVSEIIFTDTERRLSLNALVHAAVKQNLEHWSVLSERNRFVECAIAAESGILEMVEAVIFVEASSEIRIRRVGNRDGHAEERIRNIMSAQEREEALVKACDLPIALIHNNGGSILQMLPSNLKS